MKNTERKLRNALTANGVFSLLSGVTMLIVNKELASLMGIANPTIFYGVGLGLVLFAISVLANARKKTLNSKAIKFIVIQDWIWVLGSAIIVVFQLFNLTWIGYDLIMVVALIVGMFAFLQRKFLSALS